MAGEKTTHEIVSRKDAKMLGLKFYITGVACPHGHNGKRYVSSMTCVECTKEFSRKWYGEDRHLHAEKINAKKRRQRERAREKINKRKRDLYAEQREAMNVKQRSDYAISPEKRLVHNRNWQARRRNNGGAHTLNDIFDIIKLQRGKCAYCRKSLGGNYHVDHIIALSRGGSNTRSNLQITCPACNFAKHASDPIDHARSLGMLI